MNVQLALLSLLVFFGFLAGIFLLAGTWQLPFFWAVFGLYLLFGIIGTMRLDPELIDERIHPKGEDKDKFGPLILTVLCLLHFGLAALDVGRWHISDNVPVPLKLIALVLTGLGWWGLFWSMQINKFFSSAIRLQPDRGQQVITSGPYHWIRHPGYAFAAVAFISEGIALGSWMSVLPVIFIVADLIYRTLLEERLLTNELPGYKEYAEKVRYRWIPGVW